MASPYSLVWVATLGGSTIRILYAGLIMLVTVFLWMLPVEEAVYDFRTALRTDTFLTATAAGVTSANETLGGDLYECDLSSIDIDSDDTTDTPVANSANCTSQILNITGLSANTTRVLEITYAYNALVGYDAINTVVGRFPFIWILLIIIFPVAAIASLFLRRRLD